VEKPTTSVVARTDPPATTNEFIASASDTDWDFTVGGFYNGYYAALETRHMQLYGETIEDLGRIAVKNRNNAVHNPFSQWRAEHGTGYVTLDDYYKDRIIAWPYRRWNCALISEGACCLLMGSEKVAKRYTNNPMWIDGVGIGTDSMRPGDRLVDWAYHGAYKAEEKRYPKNVEKPTTPYPEMANFGFAREAAKQAYAQAGIKNPRKDIDVAEVHDCFTITEAVICEDLGFTPRGKYKQDIEAGTFNIEGEIAVNSDGGLKCFGHPVGATGLRMVFESWIQLRGKAGPRQIKNACIGISQNYGGLPGGGISGMVIVGARD
jgi:acetyl-CoA C-acetyltransferase